MTPHKQLTPDEAFARLADRCATAEICTGEALDKLRAWGIGPTDAVAIVQRLVDGRFIDDVRFAHAWVRDRLYNARWGVLKIRAAARARQLDESITDEAIGEELDEERYFANLAAALRSKARNMPENLTYADRMRLARFAVGRGYEPALVHEMLRCDDYWRSDGMAD